jgi:hypothetical protein
MLVNMFDKLEEGGLSIMTIMKRICCAVLLVSFLALAGCPEVAQQGGGSSSGEPKKDKAPD